jgi:hypothetical protein
MDLITVTLHDGEAPTQRVTVSVMDAIQTLQDQIPAGGRRWIVFRGSLVMAAFSFRHHGIKDGDDLYVVRPKSPLKTRPGLAFHEPRPRRCVPGTVHRAASLLREAARLSDLAAHRALIRRTAIESADNGEAVQARKVWETVLDGAEVPCEPSTEPLPKCWK